MENLPPTPPQREHRLYQASFLLRDYGFTAEEMPFEPSGNLPSHVDPKLAWAQMNLLDLPVELNHASRYELLRIPGIGPHGATAILNARREQRINSLSDLRRIGVQAQRALPFILINGRRPDYQPSLFSF